MADLDVDFNKLKVPELKKLLKERNLATSGNKSELIARLQDVDGQDVVATVSTEELEEDVLDESVENTSQEEEKENATEAEQTDSTEEQPEKEMKTEEVITPEKETIVKISNKSDAERKEERAKKFGIVTEQTLDAKKLARAERFNLEDSKKKSRAERFGIITDTKATTTTTAADKTASLDKLKQRAERFGTVTSKALSTTEDSEKLKKRAERFGNITSPKSDSTSPKSDKPQVNNKLVADEKLLKRKERFGTPITPPSSNNVTKEKPSEEVPAKKKKHNFAPITAP